MEQANKPFAPATERNRAPILAELQRLLSGNERVLEIGSGTGQHAVHFAAAMPGLCWQTSDVAEALPGIRQWLDEAALDNTPAPLALDCREPVWPALQAEVVFSANAIHIMGWAQVQQLFRHLDAIIQPQGLLILYGPFNIDGDYTSASNAEFDQWLQARDPASGIRDLEAVDALAKAIGLRLSEQVAMPANNFLMVWQRG